MNYCNRWLDLHAQKNIPTCMLIENDRFVLPTDEKAIAAGYYFDERLPQLVRKFVESFKILSDDFSGGAGRPFTLIPWQWATINTLYGWRRADGRLRFSQASIWLPRRQGKSILVSGLSLFHAVKDARAEIYILASTKEQAGVIYRNGEQFIESSPKLQQRLKTTPSHKQITDTKNNSIIKVLSADKVGKSGTSTSLLLCDEIHEWPKCYAREVWNRLTPSLASKQNSLLINISTAGTDKDSLSYDQYRLARNVLDGVDDNLHLLPIIYECPEFAEWQDENNWWPALPSAGVTVPKDYYREEYKKLKSNPLEENSFRRQLLNQWCGAVEAWLPANVWANCRSPFNEADLYGAEAVIGIDYGACYDLTAWVVIVKKGEAYYLLPRFAIPREVAKAKQEKGEAPYAEWAANSNNNLYFTEGDTVDGKFLVKKIGEELTLFNVQAVRYDRTRLEIIRQDIAAMGVPTIDVSQGAIIMSPAFSLFERLARECKLKHNDNPILNWNLDNCRPKKSQNDLLSIHKSSDAQKIDGIDAACIGLTHFINNDPAPIELAPGENWFMIA